MKFHKRRSLSILIILMLSFASGFFLIHQSGLHSAFYDVCDLVEEKFYLESKELTEWVSACRMAARRLPLLVSRERVVAGIQEQMRMMRVSHFSIYSPIEDNKLWRGQAVETGLRARWVEDHMIVYQVLRGSPAERSGIRIGDELLKLNGQMIESTDAVSSASGIYSVLSRGEPLEVPVEAEAIYIDGQPHLEKLSGGAAVLELSSFRSEYFDAAQWKSVVNRFAPYNHLIVDVRENLGGNFAAMLRALSPFFCAPTVIGKLEQPRKDEGFEEVLVDNLSDDHQIGELDELKNIILKTYSGYGCYRGKVTVLIGPHTSSTAEIFAEAMKARPRTRVWGLPTAGDVVLAVWYDLPRLGDGYSLSIPQALFVTPKGQTLEGQGVVPQRELFDRLPVWRQGQDSSIRDALE